MKTPLKAIACLGFAAALSALAAPPAQPLRVNVTFDHPEKFTDIKDAYVPSDKGEQAILDQIRDFIVDRASPMVPEGYRLAIVFSDVDLAGEYEPWRGPRWDMVRVIKAVYPPAFRFTYTVTDRSGRVVSQGSEFIRDMSFQFESVIDPTDGLRYEKAALGDWLRSHLGDLKGA
jgi:hypothetical protein